VIEYLRVFRHVGFLFFGATEIAAPADGGDRRRAGYVRASLLSVHKSEIGFKTLFSGVMSCAEVL
jgi:hypothetical protein